MKYHVIALALISLVSLLVIRPYPTYFALAQDYGPLRKGDMIEEVNGVRVQGVEFYNLLDGNVTMKISRETFPYVFQEKEFSFTNVTHLKTEFRNSNLKMTPFYITHFGFLLNGSADERLRRAGIFFLKEGNVYEVTEDIKELVEDECKLEVRFGNRSISYKPCSGFDCKPYVHKGYVKEGENYYLVWKYGFVIYLNGSEFAEATNGSKIGECISGMCYLADKLEFLLNNETIGYSLVPVTQKGKEINETYLVGFAYSQAEAMEKRNKLLACVGTEAASVEKVYQLPPKYDIWLHLLPALAIPVMSGVVLTIAQRKKERIYYSFLFPAYLPIIMLVGLAVPVDPTFMAGVVLLSILNSAFIVYAGYKLKEFHEGEAIRIKKGITKVAVTLIILGLIFAFWKTTFLLAAAYGLLSLIFDRKFIPELMRL